mmetsp:Transcript_5867/g.9534  ORF Transcript_5867/g.9534 Transcript_5867/m.9534 type:complete len:87 (-) Transcript_5867:642-902(-)
MASNPSTGRVYNKGVFYNKRVNFYVFRTIIFNLLCNKTGRSSDSLFNALTTGLPESPSHYKEDKTVVGDRRSSAGRLFIDLNTMFD